MVFNSDIIKIESIDWLDQSLKLKPRKTNNYYQTRVGIYSPKHTFTRHLSIYRLLTIPLIIGKIAQIENETLSIT